MPRVYTWRFKVRTYELDAFGHVNNAIYQNYLEEGATQASADCGFDYNWYMDHHQVWVVRKMTVRYLTPLKYGDGAVLHTWVSDFRRVRSNREYDLRCASDDQPVVRARADWVFVDMETMRPQRIPEAFKDAFEPTGELEALEVRLRNPTVFPDSPRYTSRRRVQRYELDPAGHVNNAVYLRWSEQAMYDAIAQAGWPVERILEELGVGVVQIAREIEYYHSAGPAAPILITSQLTELARVRGTWVHEMRHEESGELLARDISVGAFVDLKTGRLCKLPDVVLEAVLNGVPVS